MEYAPDAWERAMRIAGRDSPGDQRRDFVVCRGGYSADDVAESPTLARAVRAVGLQRIGGSAPLSLETSRGDGRSRAVLRGESVDRTTNAMRKELRGGPSVPRHVTS